MSKLLLNTGLNPLHDAQGAPVPSGAIVLSDELDEALADALTDDGVLVAVKPSEVPEDATAHVSPAALAHIAEAAEARVAARAARRGGNGGAQVRDDAGVSDSTNKGGNS